MFHKTRTMWHCNNAISNIAYDAGERDKKLTTKIMAPEDVVGSALTWLQLAEMNRHHNSKEAALRILSELAGFWQCIAEDPRFQHKCNAAVLPPYN